MSLNINDTIIYGTDGVCKVIEIAKKEFSGQIKEYYVLKPLRNASSTIYIPVHSKKAAAKIKHVLSSEEIYKLVNTISNENTIWIDDEAKRKEEYRQILATGERIQLIRLIKTLYLHSQERKNEGKKLHASDERLMKEAEKILYEEFSHVLNIQPDEVLPFILGQIKTNKNTDPSIT